MVETAIDDVVWIMWSQKIDCLILSKEPYAKISRDEIDVYSRRKIAEHKEVISKLKAIQEFITNSDNKDSIQPLIDHHGRLQHAYWRVKMVNKSQKAKGVVQLI